MLMEKTGGELYIFVKVWIIVYISLCYCYVVGKFLPNVMPRLFAVLPTVILFLALPLSLSSVHFVGTTSFFIAWLASFKLLLFAFGKGPLCTDPSISLGRFVAVASFPIKIQDKKIHPNERMYPEGKNKENSHLNISQKSILNYPVKVLLLGLLFWIYKYIEYIHPKVILVLYTMQLCIFLDVLLATVASSTQYLLGVEMAPQFNKPYLSNSLHNFWGRRWNIMVSRILHQTVYEPLLNLFTLVIGRWWAPLPAVFGTFSVSALMHELIYYYLGRVKPTWEITWFFLLHGFCLMVEIGLRKARQGRPFRLPRLVSIPLTVGFVIVTSFWLFFPQLLRCKIFTRASEEYVALGTFGKEMFSRWIIIKGHATKGLVPIF